MAEALKKYDKDDTVPAIISLILTLLPILLLVALGILSVIILIGTRGKKQSNNDSNENDSNENDSNENDSNESNSNKDDSIKHSPLLTIFTCKHKKIFKHTRGSAVICLLQCFCLLLYFYDDMIEFVTHRYHDNLKCDRSCMNANLVVARLASVFSATLLHFLPLAFKAIKYEINNDYFEKLPILNEIFRVLADILKIEAAYNAFSIAVQYRNFCDPVEVGLGWILLIASGIIVFVLAQQLFHRQPLTGWTQVGTFMILFLTFLLIFSFLLSDTTQPLGCAFNCDLNLANSTVPMSNLVKVDDAHCCRVRQHAVARLSLTIVALVVTIALPALEIVPQIIFRYTRKNNKVGITDTS